MIHTHPTMTTKKSIIRNTLIVLLMPAEDKSAIIICLLSYEVPHKWASMDKPAQGHRLHFIITLLLTTPLNPRVQDNNERKNAR